MYKVFVRLLELCAQAVVPATAVDQSLREHFDEALWTTLSAKAADQTALSTALVANCVRDAVETKQMECKVGFIGEGELWRECHWNAVLGGWVVVVLE